MPRVNIYIPPEMKQLMEQFEGRLNWSGIAQKAFNEAITTETMRQDFDDALAREIQHNLREWIRASDQTQRSATPTN